MSCLSCGASEGVWPVVGLCGPCTTGEGKLAGSVDWFKDAKFVPGPPKRPKWETMLDGCAVR